MNSELYQFRFVDDARNDRLLAALKKGRCKHLVGPGNIVYYFDEDSVGSVIDRARDEFVKPWGLISCPPDWSASYIRYMKKHRIKYCEEINDGELWFLVSGHLDPHEWVLDMDPPKPVRRTNAKSATRRRRMSVAA
jgi:hypothetical protein